MSYALTSPDGSTWTQGKQTTGTPLPVPFLENASICIAATEYGPAPSGPDCDHLDSTAMAPGSDLSAALETDDGYLVAGTGGIYASSDGVTWTQVLSAPE